MNAVAEAFENEPAIPPRRRGRKVAIGRRVLEAMRKLRPAAPPQDDRRAKLKMAALSWMAIYPLVTVLLVATAPVFDGAPIYVRTLVASLIMVPAMIWLIQPRLARLAGVAPKPIPKAPADYCL